MYWDDDVVLRVIGSGPNSAIASSQRELHARISLAYQVHIAYTTRQEKPGRSEEFQGSRHVSASSTFKGAQQSGPTRASDARQETSARR